MGRKRKNIEDVKTSKTIRLKPTMWKLIKEEHEKLGNRTFVSTIEHILIIYFKKNK